MLQLAKTSRINCKLFITAPPWPNGYGIGLLNRGLGVRVPPEVIKIFLTKIFWRLSLFGHVAISRKKFLWAYYVLNIYCLHLYRSLMRIYFALLLYTILYWEGRLKVLWPWNDIDTAVFCMIFQLCWPFLLTSNKILLRLLIQSPCVRSEVLQSHYIMEQSRRGSWRS